MQIWGVTMLGCYDCWPKRTPIGGLPCRIDVSVLPLVRPRVAEGAVPEAIAASCQAEMQAEVERLVSLRS